MAEYDLPILLHPARGANFPDYLTEKKSKYEMWWAFGWPYETSVAMARIVFAGIFDKHPDIKIVTHHYGAMIPYFEGRVGPGPRPARRAHLRASTRSAIKIKKRPFDYFKMFYADTAVFGSKAATECGLAFFGADKTRLRIRRAVRSREGADVHSRDDQGDRVARPARKPTARRSSTAMPSGC